MNRKPSSPALLFGSVLAALALVAAAPAAAASAPTASTGPTTAVGPTTATVSGSVNPDGVSTSWYVEYGTSTSYGSKTATTSAGSGTAAVDVTASLSGLKAGTTYHYRIVATSGAGTGHGGDGLFSTSAAPVATTGSAVGASATAATLTGTVDPSGRPTSWYFELGTSTSYGTKTPAKDAGSGTSTVAVAAPVTGLTSGKTYHYRLVATSDAGTSTGADKMFVPAAVPAVTTKPASSVKDTSATLNATVVPNGQSTTVYFDYGTSTSYGAKTGTKSVGSGTGSTNVAIGITGLAPGATYHARLVATNATGTTLGSDVSFVTPGPPVARTGSASGVGTTGATLGGTVDPVGHSTSWYFQYGTSTAYSSKTAPQSAGSTPGAKTVTVALASLTPSTTYHYRLVASSSSGTVYGADATLTTAAAITLTVPVTSVTYGARVTLTGTISSRQPNASVAVFRQGPSEGSFVAVATVLTGPGGTWSLTVKPGARTSYKALWGGGTSTVGIVGVRPAVTLRTLPKGAFAARVAAGRSFRGRVVQLQRRLAGGTWRTIARARLDRHSRAVFHPKLPRGRSTLRVAMSVNQAGNGYLGGFGAPVSYRR